MLSRIAERFYWHGMADDVKEFCKTCDKCQRANRYTYVLILFYAYALYTCSFTVYRKFDKTSSELHPIPGSREKYGTP